MSEQKQIECAFPKEAIMQVLEECWKDNEDVVITLSGRELEIAYLQRREVTWIGFGDIGNNG